MTRPEPASIINVLKLLTTASPSREPSERGNVQTPTRLDLLLQNNTVSFEEQLETDSNLKAFREWWIQDTVVAIPPESTPRWKFVTCCLKTLHLLQKSLKESSEEYRKKGHKPVTPSAAPVMSPDTLNFNDLKVVKTVLQFVVCLGICPYLQIGVGIPLELRSGFSDMVAGSEHSDKITESEKCANLFLCLKVLTSCIFNPALGTTVLTQHLTDVLAGLFQLIHTMKVTNSSESNLPSTVRKLESDIQKDVNVPSKVLAPAAVEENATEAVIDRNKESQTDISETSENRAVDNEAKEAHNRNGMNTVDINEELDEKSTEEEREISAAVDVKYCEQVLNSLVQKVYPPLLVKTLLLLQGGPRGKPGGSHTALPPAPNWLRRVCGQQLTGVMVRPKGVLSVLRGMLDVPGAGRGMTGAADWRKCDAVAKVIAHCPKQAHSVEAYYKKVAPQIVELLHIEDKQLGREFLRVACSTLSNMASQQPALAQAYLIQPLLAPLLACLADTHLSEAEDDVVSEARLGVCVEDCHKVFVCGVADQPDLVTSLQTVVLVLFKLLVFTKSGLSSIRTAVQEILVAFLKESELAVSLTCLQLMTFDHSQSKLAKDFPRMHPGLKFANGSSGGVKVIKTLESDCETSQDMCVSCVVSLLKDLQKFKISGDFVVYMLNELTSFIQTETQGEPEACRSQPSRSCKDSQALVDLEQQNQSRVDQFYRKLMLLNVLATVCEELGPACIGSARQTLHFVKATLERGVEVCKATQDVMFAAFESETLTMAMGLLTAVLTGAFELTELDRKQMEELLPLLLEISEHHTETSVQEMATDIRIAIATHGAVWSEVIKGRGHDFSQTYQKMKTEQKKSENVKEKNEDKVKPKIEILQSSTAEVHDSPHGQKVRPTSQTKENSPVLPLQEDISIKTKSDKQDKFGTKITGLERDKDNLKESDIPEETTNDSLRGLAKGTGTESELDIAFKELCDALIPVRGHGLIRLTKLVKTRDPSVVDRKEAVLRIFEENLDHPDSYLYLSAVNGLSALCDMDSDLVLPRLCEQFSTVDSGDGRKRSTELRMKLGEIIVKATRGLGETLPQYRDLLVRTVLVGARDQEGFVRASSLSNLGDICKLLRFSLGNVVHEVFNCCSSLLRSDKDAQVRKAAGQALVLLLQGMGQDVFKILGSVVKDLYRLLKQTMVTETDEGVKVHAQLALEELDIIMREQLFPEQKLEKKIRVLSTE